jgi:hypothetical protein
VAFGTNCRSAPVPFIFLRHYCTQMRVDLFCFLDAANFFWTTIALAPSSSLVRSWRAVAFSAGGDGGRRWPELPARNPRRSAEW